MIKKNISYKIPFVIFKEGKHFIAYSSAFDLSTCGMSEKHAERNFKEIVEIFLEEIIQMSKTGK